MSVGAWTPNNEVNKNGFRPENTVLQVFIDLSQKELLETMAQDLEEDLRLTQHQMMRLSKETWWEIAEGFSDDELQHLIRFFTRAEMLLSGWEAGAESPVIWLNKLLRKRGAPLSREQLLWIKSNTTNKFIPNGALG